mmetsp:Transcript_860/g.2326  ORF Transcript_860/g.2326 Transcript_860/m.2326 type:complete len:115 (-) Transcript_860:2448-2792(-)
MDSIAAHSSKELHTTQPHSSDSAAATSITGPRGNFGVVTHLAPILRHLAQDPRPTPVSVPPQPQHKTATRTPPSAHSSSPPFGSSSSPCVRCVPLPNPSFINLIVLLGSPPKKQ